jgi:hypothetical protein
VLLESALLRGTVDVPRGATLETWFEYGPGASLTRRTRTVFLTAAEPAPTAQLANLTPRALWSYRLVARQRGRPATLSVGATRRFALAKPVAPPRVLLGAVDTRPGGVAVHAVVSATADVAVELRLRRTGELAFRTVQTTAATIGGAGQDVFLRLGAGRLSPGSYFGRVVASDGGLVAARTFRFTIS